jgi:hypothetical protein
MATQFLARPSEMLMAISVPEGEVSKVLQLPSGRVIWIILFSLLWVSNSDF